MKIKYKKSLVGFVDVMGFKGLLTNDVGSRDFLSKYFSYIDNTQAIEKAFGITGIEIMAVSDSVVYSVPLSKSDKKNWELTAKFINVLAELQYKLARDLCLWTRGGISVGDLQMDSKRNFVVGQAFVDALLLEKTANYPRIIIDPKVLKYFGCPAHYFCSELKESYRCHVMDFVGETDPLHPPWPNDFVQVDWLGYGLVEDGLPEVLVKKYGHLIKDSNLNEYFADLQNRQHSDTDLFRKSQLLLRYLVESCHQYRNSRYFRSRKHVHEIFVNLHELTGLQIRKIPTQLILE